MPDDLYEVRFGASEDVKIARVGIPAECLLHLQRQAIHPAPHIGPPDSQPDTHTRRNRDHRRSSASSTRRRAFASTPLPIRMRYLSPNSISIVSIALDVGAVGATGSAVTVTGSSSGPLGPACAPSNVR